MTVKLNYIGIVVSDMARALAFYRSLGLPIPEDIVIERHMEIDVDGLRIAWETEALMRELNPAWTPPGGPGRIGVGVQAASPAGVDEALARLRAAGHAVPDAFDAPWGQRYATVTDPDGTHVDVFAWQEGKGG
ncbi:VOC family protein [Deinococcus sp.]|uniref:VOC family protein n=1 Tax=Deinococcus sp. TaxID=47478 RepID=UPI002869C0DA|nr:VOC family protein [Deinococcus sp.]